MARIDPPRTPNIPPHIFPLRTRQFRIPRSLSALRHRNYRLFIFGQLIATAGTWMQIIAQGWLVYEISGSELALGVVSSASAIPVLLISPWGGVIVDRVSKRHLLMITQSSSMLLAFTLSALVFTDVVRVWHIVLLAVAMGVVSSFDGPARQAFVVEMVGHEDLPNAIALNSMTFNSGRIVGPAIGGVLLVTLGAAWCFFLNGLSIMAVLISLLNMNLPVSKRKRESRSARQQLASGLAYVQHEPELRALLLMALVFSTFGTSYATILPAFVDKVLAQSASAYGTINAITGIGAVTAAFFIAQFGERIPRGRVLAGAILVFPVILVAFAYTKPYALSLTLAYGLGVTFMLVFTLLNTLLQTNLRDELRGRVLSLYTLTFFGFAPFGNLLVGSLSEAIGISPTLVISASISLLLAALILITTPGVRRLI